MRKQDNHTFLTTAPICRVIPAMAVPTVISMLVTSIYNLVDTYFVGLINTQATAAVGVVFPVMAIIQSIGFLFGQGSGTYMSRHLGAKRIDEARQMAATSFVGSIVWGLIITILGLIFLRPLSIALGSTPTILPYTMQFMGVILLGAPLMTASMVINNQMRFQGNATQAMYGMISGAVLNVVLVPLFMFTFGLGILGTAIGTVLSQLFGFIMLWVMSRRGENIPIDLKLARAEIVINNLITMAVLAALLFVVSLTVKYLIYLLIPIGKEAEPALYGAGIVLGIVLVLLGMSYLFSLVSGSRRWHFQQEILKGGTPSLTRQALASIATLMLNVAAGVYGDAAIAGMSIVSRLAFIIFAIIIGVGQGYQPFCGFNYGAGLYKRLRRGFYFTILLDMAVLVVMCGPAFIFAEELVDLLRDDPEVVAVGAVALRWQLVALPMAAVVTVCNMTLQTTGQSVSANILAAARNGIFFIPLILILPHVMGLFGVEICQAVCDVLAFLLAIPLIVHFFRSTLRKGKQ